MAEILRNNNKNEDSSRTVNNETLYSKHYNFILLSYLRSHVEKYLLFIKRTVNQKE